MFGPDENLWIGTGDAAKTSNPQDVNSLAGKVLLVDRNGRKPGEGPLKERGAQDSRIFSYGHRNIQGITFVSNPKNGVIGYTAEHGSDIDDEINPLVVGNFGWEPNEGYSESGVPMTDKKKFPNAIDAFWSSGNSTIAPSGIASISGKQWKSWDGALALAVLKDKYLKILTMKDDGTKDKEFSILAEYGRLRDVEQAPDGSLYITTDNGEEKDVILRVTPVE